MRSCFCLVGLLAVGLGLSCGSGEDEKAGPRPGSGGASGGGGGGIAGSGGDAAVLDSGSDSNSCPNGQKICGASCVDVSNDLGNCGSCGHVCPAGEVCSLGSCGVSCSSPTSLCGSICVDLQTSNQHCGVCDAPCGNNENCLKGSCTSNCANGKKDGTETDVDCGGSCAPCGAGKSCTSGKDCKAELACLGAKCWKAPPLGSTLRAYFRFEGNAKDFSTYKNDGKLNTVGLATGKVGKAASLKTTSCVTVPDSNSLDMTGSKALTVMAWVKFASCTASHGIILNKESSYELGIICSNKTFQVAVNGGSGWTWAGTGKVVAGHMDALSDDMEWYDSESLYQRQGCFEPAEVRRARQSVDWAWNRLSGCAGDGGLGGEGNDECFG